MATHLIERSERPQDWSASAPAGGPSDPGHDGRVCALIGRLVGEGEAREFIAGEKFETKVPLDARLDLGVSDVWHFDNSGEFLVTVTVDGKRVDFTPLQGPSPVPVPEGLSASPKAVVPATASTAGGSASGNGPLTSADLDHFVGWYRLEEHGPERIIPIYRTDNIGIPLARIPAPPSRESGVAPPDVRIGIPSWH